MSGLCSSGIWYRLSLTKWRGMRLLAKKKSATGHVQAGGVTKLINLCMATPTRPTTEGIVCSAGGDNSTFAFLHMRFAFGRKYKTWESGQVERKKYSWVSCPPLRIPGPLTPWLAKLTSLKKLLLDHNQLSGRLPKTIQYLRDLKVMEQFAWVSMLLLFAIVSACIGWSVAEIVYCPQGYSCCFSCADAAAIHIQSTYDIPGTELQRTGGVHPTVATSVCSTLS